LLHELNPELRYRITPDVSYELRIPPDTKGLLLARLDEMPASALPFASVARAASKPAPPKPAAGSIIMHKVRKGETLSGIANKYGVSVSQIVQANNKRKKNTIIAGEQLRIPVARGYASKSSPKSAKYARTHVVRSGDTLWMIAQRYGTTPKEIMKINNLNSHSIRIGQVLKIPVPVVETHKEKRNYSMFR
jgi:membrane-bound lytic murein transglycosylase D